MTQDQYEYIAVDIRYDQDKMAERNRFGAEGWEEVGTEPLMERRIDSNAPQGRIYATKWKMVKVGEKVRFKRRKQ